MSTGPSAGSSTSRHHVIPGHRAAGALLVVAALAMLAMGCASSEDSSSGTTQPRGAQGSMVGLDDTTPQPGGSVAFGLEAEADGFDPVGDRWAIAGTTVALAVYDTLTAYNEAGEPVPYLAERLDHDATGTNWTIKLRPGVKYSDGTPLMAADLKQVLELMQGSALVGPALRPIQSITAVDDLTVTIAMSTPWFSFPATLTSQIGVVPKPSTLIKGADGDTPASLTPIGTGPFTQVEWRQGSFWKGKRNPDYWRKDAKGVPLPYLDEIEFKPIVDAQARQAALDSGDIQMLHTDEQASIKQLREQATEGKIRLVEDGGEGEESFVMFNVSKAPTDDLNIRRALVAAVDAEDYVNVTAEGLVEPAHGPFRPGSKWYAPTTGYPAYNPDEAKKLVDAYKAAHGGVAPAFKLAAGGNDGILIKRSQYLEQAWKAVGFDVTVSIDEQTAFIANAVTGNYQVDIFRQFGSPDPDYDYIWWTSANATGLLTLNIARNQSPCVDAAIEDGREKEDLAARKQAYAKLQQCFADEVPYLFLFHDIWVVASTLKVHNISNGPLPDGQPSIPLAAGDFGGVVRLTNTWVEH